MKNRVLWGLLAGLVGGCGSEPNQTAVDPADEVTMSEPAETVVEPSSAAISAEREALAAGSDLPQPTTETALLDCESMQGIDVHCGYKNPEDLVIAPNGEQLIVSEMGEFMLDSPGKLSMLDLRSGERAEIAIDWSADGRAWGADSCPAPEVAAFSPHGIDLITRPDGRHQLLVVNHGKRESVEFFELVAGDTIWSLAWRGCALPPGDPFINDVAGLVDGGFVVTHMWDKSMPLETVVERLDRGENVGWVWEWQADDGFTKLPGSDEVMPNGIAVSADNSKIYVNVYLGNRVIRIDRASGMRDGVIDVQQPDNVTVDDEGSLWIASHKHDPIGQTCAAVTAGPCLLPYEVLKVDPEAWQAQVVAAGDGAPMGYTTVALRVGDRLYLGSAHGDRVASHPISP